MLRSSHVKRIWPVITERSASWCLPVCLPPCLRPKQGNTHTDTWWWVYVVPSFIALPLDELPSLPIAFSYNYRRFLVRRRRERTYTSTERLKTESPPLRQAIIKSTAFLLLLLLFLYLPLFFSTWCNRSRDTIGSIGLSISCSWLMLGFPLWGIWNSRHCLVPR